MASWNLRGEAIPTNLILMTADALPAGFTNKCSLFSKYLIGIPTACTNPGSTSGAATHTHASGGAHCHGAPFSQPHSHTGGTGAFASPGPPIGFSGSVNPASGGLPNAPNPPHSHPVTTGVTSTTITQSPAAAHCHGSGPSEAGLKRTTIRYITRSDVSINMRSKQVATGIVGLWDKTLATIHPDYANCSAFHDRYVKGIASAGAATLVNTGAAAHVHPTTGSCHTHPLSASAHTHPVDIGAPNQPRCWNPGPFPSTIAVGAHPSGHPVAALSPSSGPFSSAGDTHTHCSTEELKRYSMSHIKRNTIFNLRRVGLPFDTNAIWLCTLATIPAGWALNSATVDRYEKGILNPCTDPGSPAGSNAHLHGPAEAPHSHPFAFSLQNQVYDL